MGKSKKPDKEKLPKELIISAEEQNYRLLFDFAYYLENLPRGSVSGALVLLRQFLKEVSEKNG